MRDFDFSRLFYASQVPGGIVQDGSLKLFNKSFAALMGYGEEELARRPFADLVHPEDRQGVMELVRRCLAGQAVPGGREFRGLPRKEGPLFLRGFITGLDYNGRPAVLIQVVTRSELYIDIVDSLHGVFFELDAAGRLAFVNQRAYQFFGYQKEGIEKDYYVLESIAPVDRERARKNMVEAMHGRKRGFTEYLALRKDGTVFPVVIYSYPVIQEGRPVGLRGVILDITERKKAAEALLETNQKLQAIIEASPLAIISMDPEGNVKLWNRSAERIFGWKEQEVLERPLPYISRDKKEEFYVNLKRVLSGEALMGLDLVRTRKDGTRIYISASAAPVYDARGKVSGAIAVMDDITERKKIEKQLKYLATHDSLTGIPNRYSFEETLKRMVAKARRREVSALLFIDVDNFKLVNDTKGHAAGDDVLIRIAGILMNNLREGDLLARLGGDEFAVLLERTSPKDALFVAEKLRRVVEESDLYLVTHRSRFNLSISVGIVMVDGTLDSQKLLSLADTALYAAKEGGRNRVSLIRPDEDIAGKLSEVNQLIFLIKKAMKENRFLLLFQPVVRISTGEVTHHEALIRLRGEDGALISPHVFIPVAEKFGLMPQIDRWVLHSALKTLLEFKENNIFINLSGVSLGDENLLAEIEDLIRKSGVEPSRLGFEITETAVVKDLMLAEQWILRLKNLGCQFALDDFGIGFSSFSYLRRLPVDYLKIDGSFIKNLDKDSTHIALVQAMNAVASTLGKKTIAEFVENGEVLQILNELNIECGQGYYLGKPSVLQGQNRPKRLKPL